MISAVLKKVAVREAAQVGGRLASKVFLVTGGTSGIGWSVAERRASEGAAVVLRDAEAISEKSGALHVIDNAGWHAELDQNSPSVVHGLKYEISASRSPADNRVLEIGRSWLSDW